MNNIQKTILNIYKEIKIICEEEEIPFYAIGGTCLGAVRHKGFIPWDDDLDIAVPIEYMDNLIELLRNKLPQCYEVATTDDREHISYLFIKVIDKRTTFIEESDYPYPDAYKGIFIDIFPLAGIPENKKSKKILCQKLILLKKLNSIRRKDNFNSTKFKLFKKITHNILVNTCQYNVFTKKYWEILKTCPTINKKNIGYLCWGNISELIFLNEWFGNGKSVPFEDTIIYIPSNYDLYLKKEFGDYMKLPPVEDRTLTHPGLVKVDKSYIDYQQNTQLLYQEI